MKRSKRFLYVVVMVVVLSITIGYAALGSEMSISGVVAEIRLKKDIRVTDFLYSDATSSASVSSVEYSNKALITDVVLPNSDSSVTYKVEVTNFGNVEMGIYELTGLPENLTYEVTDYTLKEKICDSNNVCASGIVKTFYVTIKYASNGYSSTNTIYSLDMKVDFRQFYSISYSDITINNYPTEVISGDTLKITFTDPIPSSVSVYLDGLGVDSNLYSFVDGVLTYNDVLGNVVIKGPRTLYSIMKMSTNGPDTNIDFSQASSATNGDGVNTVSGTEADEYPIYYYRGNVENNNVLFAGFCWKMVRTTELGGVKLVYNYLPTDGTCLGEVEGQAIDYHRSDMIDDEEYARYIYSDGTDSNIKSVIDNWYESNLIAYSDFFEDAVWCNDWSYTSDSRLYNNMIPTLECAIDYSLTVAADDIGRHMKYPIAILTADEYIYSGINYNTNWTSNPGYLGNNSYDYWTLTSSFDESENIDDYYYWPYMFEIECGTLNTNTSNWPSLARYSIVLKNGINVKDGDGSANDPYILDVPNVINFTIDGITYYALDGMTWGDWLETDSNTLGFVQYGSVINPPDKVNEYCVCSYYEVGTTTYPGHHYAQITDTIENGRSYHTEYY